MTAECPCCRQRTRTWQVGVALFAAWATLPPVWHVVPPPPWGHRWMMDNGYGPGRDRDRDDPAPPAKAGRHRPPPKHGPPPEDTAETW